MPKNRKQRRPRLKEKELDWLKDFRNQRNIGVIADTHAPFTHPAYLDFCSEVFERYNVETVIHIGDEIDHHANSFHEKDPDGHSSGKEAELAQKEMDRWFARFPNVYVCIGNHTARIYRKAQAGGLSKRFLRSYEETWGAPEGWQWAMFWQFHGVMFTHGTGSSGKTAHRLRAEKNRQPTVIGHVHSHAGADYLASHRDIIWGMNVGCGINIESYAFEYGKDFPDRPLLSCGLVLDSGRIPLVVPIPL